MTKTTKKTTKKTETVKTSFVANLKTPAILHKGVRATIGMYGAAYEAALPVYKKAVKNYDDYAVRGEKLETVATTYAKDTRKTVTDFAIARFEKRSAQLRAIMPHLKASAANDRVVELEAEIAKLNKKIVSFAKSTSKKVAEKAA